MYTYTYRIAKAFRARIGNHYLRMEVGLYTNFRLNLNIVADVASTVVDAKVLIYHFNLG